MGTKDLKKIGFKKREVEGAVFYELKGKTNDYIYYNPKEKVYKFYYKTVIGDNANHVHLIIDNLSELITILQVFQFKFFFLNFDIKK